jgi:hypothetical protein
MTPTTSHSRDRTVERPASEYWALWLRTGEPAALLAWGDALARDRVSTAADDAAKLRPCPVEAP